MNAAPLLLAIERGESESSQETYVTLIFHGLLISGFITAQRRYLTHLANAERMEDKQKKSQASPENPTYIHLRDASYYQYGQKPNLDHTGCYTRVPLAAVLDFSLGETVG